MNRYNQQRDEDLIDLGAVNAETKGPPLPVDIDENGALGGGGITND